MRMSDKILETYSRIQKYNSGLINHPYFDFRINEHGMFDCSQLWKYEIRVDQKNSDMNLESVCELVDDIRNQDSSKKFKFLPKMSFKYANQALQLLTIEDKDGGKSINSKFNK